MESHIRGPFFRGSGGLQNGTFEVSGKLGACQPIPRGWGWVGQSTPGLGWVNRKVVGGTRDTTSRYIFVPS